MISCNESNVTKVVQSSRRVQSVLAECACNGSHDMTGAMQVISYGSMRVTTTAKLLL